MRVLPFLSHVLLIFLSLACTVDDRKDAKDAIICKARH